MTPQKVAAWFDLITGKRLSAPTPSISRLLRDSPYTTDGGLARHNGQIVEARIKVKGPGRPGWPEDQWRFPTDRERAQITRRGPARRRAG